MSNILTLNVYLNKYLIGTLVHLPGDKNIFTFDQKYIDDQHRPTLSLSFESANDELITNVKMTQTRLPPFFANLLPEGEMRKYLASRAHVNISREFHLLSELGYDLPGAISVHSAQEIRQANQALSVQAKHLPNNEGPLRFSLAGIQLKFSAIKNAHSGLTVPMNGIGGSWIVKLPAKNYHNVPENEFAMMELARQMGINVPETMLIPISEIKGIPEEVGFLGKNAFAIKRFDRTHDGDQIHIEDFAQVFGVYPEEKYKRASYRNIAEVVFAETGEEGIVDFIRRFVFNALIGNGDMHLKNWSLIYLDKIKPSLAPAYDFLSTIPYIPNETLALKFVDSNAFQSLTLDQFKRFALKARLSEHLVIETVKETVEQFIGVWKTVGDLPLENQHQRMIDSHLKTIPLLN